VNRVPVKSSNIKSIGHDPAEGLLHVEFSSGDIYEYSGVSPAEHAALISSGSIGTHFHAHLRGKKPGRKIEQ
jgi:KTSC domain-containing protein